MMIATGIFKFAKPWSLLALLPMVFFLMNFSYGEEGKLVNISITALVAIE